MKILKIIVAFSIILFVTACSTTSYKPLNVSIPDIHKSAEIDILVKQHEINKDFVVSTGGQGFGLIGSLIDSGVNRSRAEDAEKLVANLRDSMIDYDFDAEVQRVFEKTFSENTNKIELAEAKVIKTVEELQKNARESKSALVITMPTSYRISHDSKSIIVDFHANIFPKNKEIYQQLTNQNLQSYDVEKLKLKDSIYRNVLIVQKKLPHSEGISEVRALEKWAANDGALVKEVLTQCITEGSKLIIDDLSNFQEGDEYPNTKITSRLGTELNGVILYEDRTKQVIRLKTGASYAYF